MTKILELYNSTFNRIWEDSSLTMVGFSDRYRVHEEELVRKLVEKLAQTGSVKDLPRSRRPPVVQNLKLNRLLEWDENHQISTQLIALNHIVTGHFIKWRRSGSTSTVQRTTYGPLWPEPTFFKCHNFLCNYTFCIRHNNCRYWPQENQHWAY